MFFIQSIIMLRYLDIWKEAYDGPIPKGGHRTAVSNYRPISLLSKIKSLNELFLDIRITTFLKMIS